jgi:diacylglycerol kinase family enzyme
MVGCGFDADVVQRLHAARDGNISHAAYFWPLIQAWRSYPFEPLSLRVDEQKWEVTARWAFIFNVPRYAMNLPIVPDAQATDGRLDLCVFARGHLWHGLKYIAGMLLGRHRQWRDVHHRTAQRIEVSAATPVPYQIDGDPGGTLPVVIETLPRYLSVITPSAVK